MKNFLLLTGLSVALVFNTASADALKNSLTNIMNTKDSTPIVDLSNLNLNAKPKPVKRVHKKRSSKAVIATVNNHKIIKKDADTYLKQRTHGKITNYDNIPPRQQKMLIQELALPLLALLTAQKELTEVEKQAIYTQAWMQKEARKVKITDEDVHTVYDQIKQQAIDNNSTQPIPPFEAIKNKLKMQMIEKMVVGNLMKDVKIEIAE